MACPIRNILEFLRGYTFIIADDHLSHICGGLPLDVWDVTLWQASARLNSINDIDYDLWEFGTSSMNDTDVGIGENFGLRFLKRVAAGLENEIPPRVIKIQVTKEEAE
jgi:hypothetical protein